ncbi:MAG: alpha/beta hydrolase [Alphaproteobacteria bacterium]|nr:alpha/beta hydrolase [Alphaproteobacteria bacterium]
MTASRSATVDPMTYWRTPPGIERGYVDCRFGQLHYAMVRPRETKAPPLVCFHATPTSWRSWQAAMPEIGRDRLVIAVDTPGYGDSAKPPAVSTIEQYAAAVGEGLDRLGLVRYDAIGNHTGSKVAVELALQRSHQVRRLVLVSAPYYTAAEVAAMKARYKEVPIRDDASHFVVRWKMMFETQGKHLPLDIIQRTYTDTFRGGLEYEWGHHAAFAYQHQDNLPRVEQPVLILNPNDSIHEATKRAGAHLKNGKLVNLQSSHELIDLKPAEFARMLRDFLDGDGKDVARPAVKPTPAAPAVKHRSVRRAYAPGRFGQLHYRFAAPERPSRRALLCLHASPQSSLNYDRMIEAMGTDRFAVAPDTPGFGGSEWPASPPAIEDYAGAMIDLVHSLGLTAIDVMGFHTGSMTAVEIARQSRGLVHRIVMYSAPVFLPDELPVLRSGYGAVIPEPEGSHTVKRWQKMWQWRDPGQSAEAFSIIMAEAFRGGPLSWWGHNAAFNYPFVERLRACDREILVLNPNDDLVNHSRRAAPLMRHGRILELPTFRHGMMDVHTEALAGHLRAFLDG